MCLAVPTSAWGPEGHLITGWIAERELSEPARAAVRHLLGGHSLAEATTWADDVREQPQYEWTKPLHFINVPREASTVDLQRDCATGECVIGAIIEAERALRDHRSTRAQNVDTLRFLVHFIGDVHQPLHVSYRDDFGGNRIDVTYLGDRETNLHAVWDTGLLRTRLGDDSWESLAKELHERISDDDRRRWTASLNPIEWANESLQQTRRIYRDLPRNGLLDRPYYESNIDPALERLAVAGVRMAAFLEAIIDGRSPTTGANDPAESESEPEPQPATDDARSFLSIVEGEPCGPDGGRQITLRNTHDSRLIVATVRKSWVERGVESSSKQTITVRPGERSQRRLGCSHQRIGGGMRTFTWEVVAATFRSSTP